MVSGDCGTTCLKYWSILVSISGVLNSLSSVTCQSQTTKNSLNKPFFEKSQCLLLLGFQEKPRHAPDAEGKIHPAARDLFLGADFVNIVNIPTQGTKHRQDISLACCMLVHALEFGVRKRLEPFYKGFDFSVSSFRCGHNSPSCLLAAPVQNRLDKSIIHQIPSPRNWPGGQIIDKTEHLYYY